MTKEEKRIIDNARKLVHRHLHIDKYREREQKYRDANRDACRNRISEFKKNNKEVVANWQRKDREDHPDIHLARHLALSIKLEKHCELCGGPAVERHHPDYSKPMFVMHLCKACHVNMHRKKADGNA
jgi:hypothetical protein